MWAFAFALAASLAAAGADASPVRVASLNLCTDELVLALADPGQVASVTHLSHDADEFVLWRKARRHARNDGSLLTAIKTRPTLVVSMGGGIRDRAGVARRLGITVLDLPFPDSIAQVEQSIMRVAAGLGQRKRGEALVGQVRSLRANAPRTAADAIFLSGGGVSVAPDGLGAEWMRLAGLRQRPLPGNRASLEELLTHPPAVLLRSGYRSEQASSQQRWLSHPLARGVRAGRTLGADGRRWTCLGPNMIGEVLRLRKAMQP